MDRENPNKIKYIAMRCPGCGKTEVEDTLDKEFYSPPIMCMNCGYQVAVTYIKNGKDVQEI